jgi:uncharacterized protein YuzE
MPLADIERIISDHRQKECAALVVDAAARRRVRDEDHYDAEVDALYIQFLETTVTTEHLAGGIAAGYDAEGRLAGIEILDALKRFGDP